MHLFALDHVYPQFNNTKMRIGKFKVYHSPIRSYCNNSLSEHRVFLDKLGESLKISSLDDWYKVTDVDIGIASGSRFVHKHYSASLFKAISTVYPEHKWYPWLFHKPPPRLWDDKQTHKNFFDWLGKELKFQQKEDFYKVKASDINWRGGSKLLNSKYNGSIYKVQFCGNLIFLLFDIMITSSNI